MARRRRAASRNPTDLQKYPVEIATGAGGIIAMLAGAPRLGGALFFAGGAYDLYKGRTGLGVVYGLVGIGGLLLPEIKSALASSGPAKNPNFTQNPPVYNASLRQGTFDEDIGGGWALIDARALRVRPINPDTDIHVGNTVSLLLSHQGAPEKVFNAKVIGISGDDFSGSWVSGAPAGGPQMIDFRGAHVFEYH